MKKKSFIGFFIISIISILSIAWSFIHTPAYADYAIISFRAASSANNGKGSTTLSIPAPAGLQSDDVLIASVVVKGPATTITPPHLVGL